ncbi:DNA pol3 gamma3 superfamily incomplete domain [Pandoravirus japonicus]|uniref:DNA pol3 gamma3 superfamily incomplete domain n=1 Tax=Pandoravirus japonicus TaxID=2823154 RepID=A0A811BPF6_9VIRU|nr:DNA pol3 gamma3 superfamily incomplete domain [Pandoravirus japonicus]
MEPNRRALPLAQRQALGQLPRLQAASTARLPPPAMAGARQPLPIQTPPLSRLPQPQAAPVVRLAPTQPRAPPARAAPLGRFVQAQARPAARTTLARPILQRAPIQQVPPLGRSARPRPAPTPRLVPSQPGRPMTSGFAAARAPQRARSPSRAAPTARFAPSLTPLAREPAPVGTSRAPTLASPRDDGCVPGRTQDKYALLRAIAEQDDGAIRSILADGLVNVNEWIDPAFFTDAGIDIHGNTNVDWPTQGYSDDDQGTNWAGYNQPDTRRLDDLQLHTTRGNTPDSLLGMAVLTGAPRSVEALIDAGALPRPTREFLLNSALARLSASHYDTPGGDHSRRPVDALGTAAVLLRRFGRSPRLHPLDMNPLSVARVTLQRSPDAIFGNEQRLARSTDAALVPLLAAGYSPDERIQAVGPPPVLVGDSRQRSDYTPAEYRDYGSPADYNAARAVLARITERQAIGSGAGEPIDLSQYTGPDSSLEVLSQLWDPVVARAAALYDSLSPRERNIVRGASMATQAEAEYEDDDDEGETDSVLSLIESLPPEVVQTIAASRGLSAQDVAALYGTSRRLAAAVAYPLAQRRGAFEAFRAPGAPCGDYAGCVATLLAAIAADDPATVRRVIESRVVGRDDLLNISGQTLYGNPLTAVTTRDSVDGRLDPDAFERAFSNDWVSRAYAGERFAPLQGRYHEVLGQRGWNYASPLALAVIAKAPDVVRELATSGARPWPSVESLLERAVIQPFDEYLFALNLGATRYDGVGALRNLTDAANAQSVELNADDTLPRTERIAPNATVRIRQADTLDVVRALVESFPRNTTLHHGDVNPLTALRLSAVESVSGTRHSPADPAAIEAALVPLIGTLLDAGYSPDERGLSCDVEPRGTTERALVAEMAAGWEPDSARGILADIFERAYAPGLPPLVSPDSSL